MVKVTIEERKKIIDKVNIYPCLKINSHEIIILLRSDFRNCFSQIISKAMLSKDIKINQDNKYLEIFDSNAA